MKITGIGSKVDVIRLKHKGQDEHFQHIIPDICRESGDIKPLKEGMIEFEDIREIDLLIDTLEHFKEYCELKIGKMQRW